MKKLLSLLLALTMILPLVGCAAFAENADPIMITVIATSDVHGKVLPINYATGEPSPNVGLSMIASMIEQVRATEKNVVLVDGGDTVQGSAMTYYYSYFAPEKDDPIDEGAAPDGLRHVVLGQSRVQQRSADSQASD